MRKSHEARNALADAIKKLKVSKKLKDRLYELASKFGEESYFQGYSEGIEVSEDIIDRELTIAERRDFERFTP